MKTGQFCGWRLAGLVVLALWGQLQLPAQTASAQPTQAHSPNRYLLIFDISRGMKNRAEGTIRAVNTLLTSGMQGQLQRGDTVGVWTFNQEVYTGQLPLQRWSAEAEPAVTSTILAFLRRQTYEKQANFDKVLPLMQRLVQDSDGITIILVSDGSAPIRGTGFDEAINRLYALWRAEQQRAQQPFLTAWRAEHGQIVQYSVTPAPWPVELPPLPAHAQPAKLLPPLAQNPGPAAVTPVTNSVTTSPPKSLSPPATPPVVPAASKPERAEPVVAAKPAETQTNTVLPVTTLPAVAKTPDAPAGTNAPVVAAAPVAPSVVVKKEKENDKEKTAPPSSPPPPAKPQAEAVPAPATPPPPSATVVTKAEGATNPPSLAAQASPTVTTTAAPPVVVKSEPAPKPAAPAAPPVKAEAAATAPPVVKSEPASGPAGAPVAPPKPEIAATGTVPPAPAKTNLAPALAPVAAVSKPEVAARPVPAPPHQEKPAVKPQPPAAPPAAVAPVLAVSAPKATPVARPAAKPVPKRPVPSPGSTVANSANQARTVKGPPQTAAGMGPAPAPAPKVVANASAVSEGRGNPWIPVLVLAVVGAALGVVYLRRSRPAAHGSLITRSLEQGRK